LYAASAAGGIDIEAEGRGEVVEEGRTVVAAGAAGDALILGI